MNRMQLFCRNCSYVYRFNCISTVYMEVNCIGIVFGNRGTYLQHLVGWGFIRTTVYVVIPVSVSD